MLDARFCARRPVKTSSILLTSSEVGSLPHMRLVALGPRLRNGLTFEGTAATAVVREKRATREAGRRDNISKEDRKRTTGWREAGSRSLCLFIGRDRHNMEAEAGWMSAEVSPHPIFTRRFWWRAKNGYRIVFHNGTFVGARWEAQRSQPWTLGGCDVQAGSRSARLTRPTCPDGPKKWKPRQMLTLDTSRVRCTYSEQPLSRRRIGKGHSIRIREF